IDTGTNTLTFASALTTSTIGTGLTKQGAGTLILANNNTYATTTISAGTLQVGTGGTTGNLGNGTLTTGTLTNNGVLVFNKSNTFALNSVVIGTGSLIQMGTGIVMLG